MPYWRLFCVNIVEGQQIVELHWNSSTIINRWWKYNLQSKAKRCCYLRWKVKSIELLPVNRHSGARCFLLSSQISNQTSIEVLVFNNFIPLLYRFLNNDSWKLFVIKNLYYFGIVIPPFNLYNCIASIFLQFWNK